MTHANPPLPPQGRYRVIEHCKTRPITHITRRDGDFLSNGAETGEPAPATRRTRVD